LQKNNPHNIFQTMADTDYAADSSADAAGLFDSGFQDDTTIIPFPKTTPALDIRPLNFDDRFRGMTNSEICEAIAPTQLPYAIMAVNITMCLNIGNMIRTANLCGASKFILFGRRRYDRRGTVGAEHYTIIDKIAGIPNPSLINFEDLTTEETDDMLDEQVFIDYIKTNNYLPVFMEQDRFSKPATNGIIKDIIQRAQALSRIPLFIFGSEGFGIPRNLLDTRMSCTFELSYTLELKQRGCIRSHNVANCCSIICYKVMEAFDELS
jgi:tRNA(Leu) C34 or U34 (ribose-2'-O)-methylase TrmL